MFLFHIETDGGVEKVWPAGELMARIAGHSGGPADDFAIGKLDGVLLRVRWSIPVRRAIQINKSGLAPLDDHRDVHPTEMS